MGLRAGWPVPTRATRPLLRPEHCPRRNLCPLLEKAPWAAFLTFRPASAWSWPHASLRRSLPGWVFTFLGPWAQPGWRPHTRPGGGEGGKTLPTLKAGSSWHDSLVPGNPAGPSTRLIPLPPGLGRLATRLSNLRLGKGPGVLKGSIYFLHVASIPQLGHFQVWDTLRFKRELAPLLLLLLLLSNKYLLSSDRYQAQ